jgi:hypothetical protein
VLNSRAQIATFAWVPVLTVAVASMGSHGAVPFVMSTSSARCGPIGVGVNVGPPGVMVGVIVGVGVVVAVIASTTSAGCDDANQNAAAATVAADAKSAAQMN